MPAWHDDQPRFETIWPDANTRTLLAVINKDDSREGWVRWTWEASGVVVTGTGMERMLPGSMDFTDPNTTHVWAEKQGWDYVAAEGPWHESI